MANVLDLRRRIRSVKNTRQITKAMKMVAAAKLRRAQERALAARPYAKMITSVLESLTRRVDLYDEQTGNLRHPLFVTRPEKRTLLVVVSGDKGFAGAFNANILKTAFQFIAANGDKQIDVEAVGRKGRDLMRRKYPVAVYTTTEASDGRTTQLRQRKAQVEVTGDHPGMLEKLQVSRVADLAHNIIQRYVHEEIDSVYIVYNEFKSVMSQRMVVERLLPIPRLEGTDTAGPAVDYLYEPGPQTIFQDLLPRHVQVQVYRALLESNAAFFAAQMTAMDAATRNSAEMIENLTLYMNKVRQAAITREIIEIVSGAAALG